MNEKKKEVIDLFGEMVINDVRDQSLNIAMQIAKYSTINPIKLEQYKLFKDLTPSQKEAVCDLLSETISDTIFNFLHMFEDYSDSIKIIVSKDNQEYNLVEMSEMLGSEITTNDEESWISKFSQIGRFII